MAPAQDDLETTLASLAPMPTSPAPAASLLSMKIRRTPPAPAEDAEPADPDPPIAAPMPAPAAPAPEPRVLPPEPSVPAATPPTAPEPAVSRPSDITAYWRQLKNGRGLPSWSDLDSKLIADRWPNSMLLRCGGESRRLTLDSLFTQALRVDSEATHAGGADGIDFTPMLTEWILSLGREAERFGRPVQDTDALPSDTGEVRYRVIALPLSDDQERIDHVLCHVVRA